MSVNGWKILLDTSNPMAKIEPSAATYAFVYIYDGKIIKKEKPYSGYTFHDQAKEEIRKELEEKLKALDDPFIMEKVVASIVEVKGQNNDRIRKTY